ncbi:Endonuclease, Uma2 family (restriction endonuclease fold) [Candidatus Fervidibacteria bacterium JGI MDM2 SSWTFF-3-K9]
MAEVAQKVLTWDEYVRGEPADLERYEIVDGVVIELPAPTVKHQRIVLNMLWQLKVLEEKEVAILLTAPCDVVVRQEKLRTRQPDLIMIRKERVPEPKALFQQERIDFAPDVVVEVLSPSDSITTLMEKLDDYHQIGVREVWLVNPATETVEVLVWQQEGWNSLGIFRKGEPIKSKALPELELNVGQVFEGV